jgi:PAS domain S-box-containing protein
MPLPETADQDKLVLLPDDDEQFDPAVQLQQEGEPWRILVVDDDVDVHVVTKFALSASSFQGRRLSFLHAYSAKEALEVLRSTPGIALVLLDVIMETDDAGLRLAREIRTALHNELVRIVLRTGQPGQALEHSIIVDYDINDFWCKADLTTRKLFTTVIASLRAYSALAAAAAARDELRTRLAEARHVEQVVEQHSLLLKLDGEGRIVDANERLCAMAGKTRAELLGQGLPALLHAPVPPQLATNIMASLAREGGWAGDIDQLATAGAPVDLRCAVLAFKDARGRIEQYVAVATPRDPQH